MDDFNPYAPPRSSVGNEESKNLNSLSEWKYTIVFLANLPVPAFAGVTCTDYLGRVGMFLGFTVAYITGLLVCRHNEEFEKRITVGGAFVACSQLIPVIQLLTGVIAIALWNLVQKRGPGDEPVQGFTAGFFVTMAGGATMFGVSQIVGYVVLWLYRNWKKVRENAGEVQADLGQ